MVMATSELSERVRDTEQPLARRLQSARALGNQADPASLSTVVELCGTSDLGEELLRELGRSLARIAVELDEVKATYDMRLYDVTEVAFLEFSNEVAVLQLS